MTSHGPFIAIGVLMLLCWLTAAVGYLPPVARRARWLGPDFLALGWVILTAYLAWLWQALDRIPMRTLGETRLWYIFFLPLVGFAYQWRFHSRLLMAPTLVMVTVFTIISLARPDTLDKTQMPALDSPWFAPHVIIYMISYATFTLAALVGLWGVFRGWTRHRDEQPELSNVVRQLIYAGFPLLTTGFILGAYWAQIAWGRYWSWDPKEVGAFITWMVYMAYIHLDRADRITPVAHCWLAIAGGLMVWGCWFAVNWLPATIGSLHRYSN